MPKETIHFAHANGFPAKTYSKLFSFLKDDFEINYLERHAHNPKFPVTDGWERLRDELREELQKCYTQKIIGVGHSLGGILHLLVAVENPEIYKAIILLDAPVISRLSSAGIKVLKQTNLMEKYSPSQITRFRRAVWQTKNEALEHFQRKEKFAKFDADVLRDYIDYGLIEKPSGWKLFFEPKIEAKIYRTIPHNLPKLRGKLSIPVAYIGGTHSHEAKLARISFMQKHFSFEFKFIKGSHLFPLENPRGTADTIKEIVNNLLNRL
ncbi:MAG: alpha/beta hydrolase [Acidobacteriota bacterium]|nr:alpha/beta hydrolase [Acidobacteriota bacterium]